MSVDPSLPFARYRLLETLRAFGRERLRETGAERELQARHARHYAALAVREGMRLEGEAGEEHGPALQSLDLERDDLRAALAWALEHDRRLALDLTRGLGLYWLRRRHLTEARQAHARALAPPEEGPPELRARPGSRGSPRSPPASRPP